MKPIPLKGLGLILSAAITAAVILFFIFNAGIVIFEPKNVGSFEYVRKAEAFLDRGKYIEAIINFEKAHEESPDNETIKQNLVYAYSKYAERLSDSKYYAKAIDYLTKARDAFPGPTTTQNLAVMYAKRAVYRTERKERLGAAEDFNDARSIASDYNNALKALSASLFNDGMERYRSGREELAVLFFKEACLSYNEPKIFEALGDLYYRKANFSRARFYYKKAQESAGEDKALADKLEKLAKEIALAKKERVEDLPHFELRYEKDLPVNEALARKALEGAYIEAGNKLTYFPKDKTTVFFYSDTNFRNIFRTAGMVRAFYDGSIRMPFPGIESNKEEFEHYIYHEYAHAVVSAKTNNNCPVWLSEGIAVWVECRGYILKLSMSSQEAGYAMISLDALDAAFNSRDLAGKNLNFYYMLAYTVVDYIVDTWGQEGLNSLLARISKGQHAINAMDDEFLLSEKEFEQRWHDYIAKKFIKESSGAALSE